MEWQICESDHDWHDALVTMPVALVPNRSRRRRWWVASSMVVLLLLAIGSWLWYQAQWGLAQVEAELHAEVEAELWAPDRSDPLSALQIATAQDIKEEKPSLKVAQTQIVELGNDWSVVEITVEQGTRTYRQRRAYRSNHTGWYPIEPTAVWGAPRRLETAFFIFQYYALDDEAVRSAAAKLDSLYPTIAASYPPTTVPNTKRTVWVSPELPLSEFMDNAYDEPVMSTASPSVNLLPVEISDGEWLAEAVLLRLLNQLAEEAMQRHNPHDLRSTQEAVGPLHRLLYSVQLWQVWSADLPLAALREPIVQWAYGDIPPGERVLPGYDAQLCDLHHLWAGAPLAVRLPLFCGETEAENSYLKWPYSYGPGWRYLFTYPWHLADRSIFTELTSSDPTPNADLSTVVGLATVLEYAAATYGPESIAKLIDYIPYRSSWETLIPTVFGVPLAEFEAGWQAYMHESYGVSEW